MAKTLSPAAEAIKGLLYDFRKLFHSTPTPAQIEVMENMAERWVEELAKISTDSSSHNLNRVQDAIVEGFKNVDKDFDSAVERVEGLEKEAQTLREEVNNYHKVFEAYGKEIKSLQGDLEAAHKLMKEVLERAPLSSR
jgi:uncharacterized coiled-coil DUF342 family protein